MVRRHRSLAPFLHSFYRFSPAQDQSEPSYPVNQSHQCNTIQASYMIAKTRKKECLQDQVLIQALKLYIVQGIVGTLLSFSMTSFKSSASNIYNKMDKRCLELIVVQIIDKWIKHVCLARTRK